MPDRINSNNVVIIGANGRVGRLLGGALSTMPQNDMSFWFQTRSTKLPKTSQWVHWNYDRGLKDLANQHDGISVLICLAGITPSSADVDYSENANIALAVCKEADNLSVPHVFVASSAAVYGRSVASKALAEKDNCLPLTAYGQSKLDMEKSVSDWQKHSQTPARVTCLRIGNVAGADQLLLNAEHAKTDHAVFLDEFENGKTPVRSYVGPQTLAKIMCSLVRTVQSGQNLPDVINVAAPGAVEMADLLAALKSKVTVKKVAAPAHALPIVALDTNVLQRFHRFAVQDSQPAEMIRQWRACQGQT